MPPTIDLVLPAFNEAPNIAPLAEELRALREDGTIRRIVLADNNSTDDTAERARAESFHVVHEPKTGYGAACLRALGWIRDNDPPDIIVFLDADLSDDATALPQLVAPIKNDSAELVIGSRVRLAQPGALNVVQRFGNQLACTMIAVLGGRRYSDLGPFRAVTWNALESMHMNDQTWGWTVEMQMKAAILNIPSTEVDVPYRTRRHGRSKISGTVKGVVTAGTKIITTILALRLQRRSILKNAI